MFKIRCKQTGFVMRIILLLVCPVIFFACAKAASAVKVKPELQIEAGSPMVHASAFVNDPESVAAYETDITALSLTVVGEIPLTLRVDGEIYPSILKVVDTVSPTAQVQDRLLVQGQSLTAEDFVTDIVDVTPVKVSYKKAPNLSKLGEQSVTILLEDGGKNKVELKAKLFVLTAYGSVKVEAGTSPTQLTPLQFLDWTGTTESSEIEASFESDISGLDFKKAGSVYPLVIIANGVRLESKIEVLDTTAPTAITANREIWLGEEIAVSDFVTSTQDASDVTLRFKTAPDCTIAGEQQVHIIAEDSFQNQAEFLAVLTVKKDTTPPVIEGARDQTVFVGDKISYKKDVTATDDRDGELDVTVNSASVNLYEVGEYKVTYQAVDTSGNQASKTIQVSVITLDPNAIYWQADQILAQIIPDGMGMLEKARKIFNWVKANVRYTSAVDKSDTLKGAYYGFKNRQGDCFTYYAVAEVLLTRAGIPNMRVTRVGGTTQHFWNLVNYGEGWYHYDTCPTRAKVDTFMFTSVAAEEYTARIVSPRNYYVYDKSLYPTVVGDVVVTEEEPPTDNIETENPPTDNIETENPQPEEILPEEPSTENLPPVVITPEEPEEEPLVLVEDILP